MKLDPYVEPEMVFGPKRGQDGTPVAETCLKPEIAGTIWLAGRPEG